MDEFKSFQIWLVLTTLIASKVIATDPIFKFVPKSSLSSLAVQTDSEYDITMIVGNNAAANTVIRMNGPFENNNAGMVGVSITHGTQGSNVNVPDFTTAKDEKKSTADDGLYDVIFKNFTSISRVTPSTETESDNKLTFTAKMKTVDLPGAIASTTLWVWASAEVGDDYVWVSEEATTIQRSASDEPTVTITASTPTLPYDTILSGGTLKMSGSIKHTAASRLNVYGVILRFYLPPYADFVQGSYNTTDSLYPSALVTYNTQTSQKELTLRYSKVGITSQPSWSFEVRLNADKLHLRAGQGYKAKIHVIKSYCRRANCTGTIESTNITITKNLRNREAVDKFLVQHIASGRCLSYTSGVNNDKVTVKASCTDLFTYDVNGGLKHVSSGACAYEDSGFIKMSTSICSNATIFYRGNLGFLRFFSAPTQCITVVDTGLEGKEAKRSTTCGNNEKFKFIDAAPTTNRLTMGRKVVLASGSNEFFYCNRKSKQSQPSCFFRNGTYTSEIKALPVAMAYVKGFDPSSREIYGIHVTGTCYIMIKLLQNPEDVFQLDDARWNTIKSKSGMVLSTDLTEASLKNYPERHDSTQYGVSLKGIHQITSGNNWQLVSRW